MRYRAKFGILGWLYVALPCFVILLKISGFRSGIHSSLLTYSYVGLVSFLGLVRVSRQIFTYWQLDSSGLRERMLWRQRDISWQEVARVSGYPCSQPGSNSLSIDYARPAPLSDRGTIIANPENRRQFLADLHRFAPQAVYDV
jgi:hypothetical protein